MKQVKYFYIALTLFWAAGAYAISDDKKQQLNRLYSQYQISLGSDDIFIASQIASELYQLARDNYGVNHKTTATLGVNYAQLLQDSDDAKSTILSEALITFEEQFGRDAVQLIDPLLSLAKIKLNLENKSINSEGLTLNHRALSIAKIQSPKNPLLIAIVNMRIGEALIKSNHYSENATGYLTKAYTTFIDKLPPQDKRRAKTVFLLGLSALSAKNYTLAEDYFIQVLDVFDPLEGDPQNLELETHLAMTVFFKVVDTLYLNFMLHFLPFYRVHYLD